MGTKRIANLIFVLYFASFSFLSLGYAEERITQPEEASGVVRSTRKSMTYFPLQVRTTVPPQRLPALENTIRHAVEQGRFTLHDLGPLKGLTLEEVAQLLRDYVDRVKLLKAREEARFDIRYKDLVVTAEDLRRIAESAFLYLPTLNDYDESHSQYLVKEGKLVYWVHQYRFQIRATVRFYRVDFATAKPIFVAEVPGYGEGEEASSPLRSPDEAREGAFTEALDSLHLDLRTRVRQIPEFKLRVNVDRATLNGAYFSLTRKDGLVLGSLLEVREVGPGGEEVPLGFLMVREIGDGEVETQSYAQIVTVKGLKLSGGEMLVEYPQKNMGVSLSLLYQVGKVTAPGEPEIQSTGQGWGLRLHIMRGFAEETGVYGLSGIALGNLLIRENYLELGAEAGLELLYHFRRLFFGGGLRFGYLRAFTTFRGESAHASSFGLTPSARVSLWLSPSFSLAGEAGYRLYLPAFSLLDEDDDPLPVPEGYRYNPSGLEANLGVVFRF